MALILLAHYHQAGFKVQTNDEIAPERIPIPKFQPHSDTYYHLWIEIEGDEYYLGVWYNRLYAEKPYPLERWLRGKITGSI